MLRVLLVVLVLLVLLVRLVLLVLVLVLVLVVLLLLQPWIAFGRRDLRSDLCVSLSSHSWAASGNATCSSVDGSHRAYLTAHAGVHSLTGAPLTPQREAQAGRLPRPRSCIARPIPRAVRVHDTRGLQIRSL